MQGPHFNMAVKNQHVCQLKRHHINTASVITDKSRTEINRTEDRKHFSGTKINIDMLPELVLERQTDHLMIRDGNCKEFNNSGSDNGSINDYFFVHLRKLKKCNLIGKRKDHFNNK